jgi:hypothetical protein
MDEAKKYVDQSFITVCRHWGFSSDYGEPTQALYRAFKEVSAQLTEAEKKSAEVDF